MSARVPNELGNLTVALEGGMAAGKSTLARSIASRLGMELVQEYGEYVSGESQIEIARRSPEERVEFFLRIEQQRIAGIRDQVATVLDRSVLTIFAFEYACYKLKLNAKPSNLAKLLVRFKFQIPHLTVHVTVDEAVRQQRLAARASSEAPGILKSADFNAELDRYFRGVKGHLPIMELNTTHASPQTSEEQLRQAILVGSLAVPDRVSFARLLDDLFDT